MIRRPPRSTRVRSSAASDVYKRQPVGPTIKRSLGSNLVSVTVFEIFRVKILTVHLLTLVRPKVTSSEDDLPSMYIYHATKFQHDRANGLRDMRYQSFSVFGPWGLTPGPKFTKWRDDLADSYIYQPANFYRSIPTHARDIRYQVTKVLRTNKKQTVTDISPACLSACGITSTPVIWTGVIPQSPPAMASLSHGPRDCPASLSYLASERPMHY